MLRTERHGSQRQCRLMQVSFWKRCSPASRMICTFCSGRFRRSDHTGSKTSKARFKFAESLRERDLYVGVGLSSQDHGATAPLPFKRSGRHRRLVGRPRPEVRRASKGGATSDCRGCDEDPAGRVSAHIRRPNRKRRACVVAFSRAADLRVRRGTPQCRRILRSVGSRCFV